MEGIKIGNSEYFNSSNKVFIIAEAGVNHDGNLKKAFQLIDIAKDSGADAVKFQIFKTEELIKKNVKKANYQLTNDPFDSQFEMLKSLELKKNDFLKLKQYAKNKEIIFLTTAFESSSLDFVIDLDLDAYKVASTDTTNLPFLKHLSKKVSKPILLSTGMCYIEEVRLALETIKEHNENIILMQCTSDYPAKKDELNLKVLEEYKILNNFRIGYSDHSIGNEATILAIGMGARCIEKHFTVNKKDIGPDHSASLEPNELKEFVKLIRDCEIILGSSDKIPTNSENDTRKSLQKGMIASKNIKKDDIIDIDSITSIRLGGRGVSPIYFNELVGKIAIKDYKKGEIFPKKQL